MGTRERATPFEPPALGRADVPPDFEGLAALLRRNDESRGAFIETPFGRRLVCYADCTATGTYLRFVEDWLRSVQPYYANTHTRASSTGRMMTNSREQAREVVRRSVNAGPEDEVLFVGAGATAALNKLVGLLGLRIPEPLERAYNLSRHIPHDARPVVLIGPYEHHSNQLPWLESIAEVEEVGLASDGRVDVADLVRRLEVHRDRPLKIGAFSAASNVDGLLTDVPLLSRTLHRGGAHACFDFAAAAPHVPIDMNPPALEERIDSIAISTHKFPGGPHGSGVLVANRSLFRSAVPERPGGGTVDYVASFDGVTADYVSRLDEREEGGTPAISGDLRAGAAFLLKEICGPSRILEREISMASRARARLARNPRIQLLGAPDLPRLAVLSLNIQDLHHAFAAVLLDHLFGIQSRAGCSCAGPYGHRLLGIDEERSSRYRGQIAKGRAGLKPGWVRVSLPHYASDHDFEYVLDAIDFVADRGLDFVPLYRFGWRSGEWTCIEGVAPETGPVELTARTLWASAKQPTDSRVRVRVSERTIKQERARYAAEAQACADALGARWSRNPPRWNVGTGLPEVDSLVWFRYVQTDEPEDLPVIREAG